MSVREQVLETIIDVIGNAEAQGQDAFQAVAEAFPGTPDNVYWEAWSVYDHRRTEQWWQQVERTIDGEIIRTALLKQGAVYSSDPR